jgi:hypothetical protein
MRVTACTAVALAITLVVAPASAGAQTAVAVTPHVGTLGLGADAAVAVSEIVSVRGGVSFQPYSPEIDLSDITFNIDLPSPTVMVTVDVHPGGHSFRFSGGFVYFANDLALEGLVDEDVDLGNNTYTPAEVGTLRGSLITSAFSPYIGIGLGNAAHGTTGFFLDAGVAFHGTPDVELSATGPSSTDPVFQADLDLEASDIRDDAESFSIYPVLSLGVRIAVR